MAIHSSLTEERVLAAAMEDAGLGFCVHCGEEADGVEPDARGYHCDGCGHNGVFGAEELVIRFAGSK